MHDSSHCLGIKELHTVNSGTHLSGAFSERVARNKEDRFTAWLRELFDVPVEQKVLFSKPQAFEAGATWGCREPRSYLDKLLDWRTEVGTQEGQLGSSKLYEEVRGFLKVYCDYGSSTD